MQNLQTEKSRCIALYPGAFRPPHAAHLRAVLDLASRPEVDEVLVIISNRCRSIPGTTLALDADAARRVWSIYLEGVRKVRVAVAPHASVKHALSYFERAEKGDTLLFCIGEKDFEEGDERFKDIEAFAKQTGVSARLVPAPTGAMSIRATDLRAALARGEAGREVFLSALPITLRAAQREQVWTVCREGMREVSEIVREKIRSILMKNELGDISDIRSTRGGKLDQVYRVRFKDGRCYFVKYAGDTVTPGALGEKFSLKPKRRLSTERRALNRLSAKGVDGVALPEVILFDKETLTLVLTEVCPGGKPLREDLEAGVFDPELARKAAHFLARCHTLPAPIAPVWGDTESDVLHWKKMLALRTVNIPADALSEPVRSDLAALRRASEAASAQTAGKRLLILDCTTQNILVRQQNIGVIDFELTSSMGDPAYDLGLFLGDYVLFGLAAASGASARLALFAALEAYQREAGELWPEMRARVLSFAGAAMLYALTGEPKMAGQACAPRLFRTAAALISAGLGSLEDIDPIFRDAVAGRFA